MTRRMPRELEKLLSGQGFETRHGVALPLVTVDPEGYPRAALLSFGQVRALSGGNLSVAVRTGSRTAANLIRRPKAMLYYLGRHSVIWLQARVGRGRTAECDPDQQIFPLAVVAVKVDAAGAQEYGVEMLTGPIFCAKDPDRVFSSLLFEELAAPAEP